MFARSRVLLVFLLMCCMSGLSLAGKSTPKPKSKSGSKQKYKDDACTSVVLEQGWFRAEECFADILDFASGWQGQRDLHCVDLFSASEAMKKVWLHNNFRAESCDIKFGGPLEDITLRAGFMNILSMCLRVEADGLIFSGPPCSMFIFMSCSVHLRHIFGPEGNKHNFKTRLANRIVTNFVYCMKAVLAVRRCWVIIEQPGGSVMYDLPVFQALIAAFGLITVSTYMCHFGHQMQKFTCLLGTLPNLPEIERHVTAKDKKKLANKAAKRKAAAKAKGKAVPVYYTTKSAAGKLQVTGGKDLPKSAEYTKRFCIEVFNLWLACYRNAASASSK
eukprot:TRINITY_DN79318_c0_g1_i1.p1 TRINITY_DN79318_c0_g1~~TRINITY_DN79318_c0_g1_i1.p1  ORF type:complete len:332 (+),score=39.67 TRINITY_DN79318_c0_g1_i1:61-1056(+)